MTIHPGAGTLAPAHLLVDVGALCDEYFTRQPEVSEPSQQVKFGTSGHRGSSLLGTFNEAHVLAITQAICDFRHELRISGPLYIGRDTHALSEPAFKTALEVLAANGVDAMIDCDDGHTPTPAISHAILTHNRVRLVDAADGIVITPSHNPPDDGGFKYNPPTGGPADTEVTRWIEDRANQLLSTGSRHVPRVAYEKARRARDAHLRLCRDVCERPCGGGGPGRHPPGTAQIGVDPLGGASTASGTRSAIAAASRSKW
jgi:phosphoglucomutase